MTSRGATVKAYELVDKLKQMEDGDSLLIDDELARAVKNASPEAQSLLVDIMVKYNINTIVSQDFKTTFVRDTALPFRDSANGVVWNS